MRILPSPHGDFGSWPLTLSRALPYRARMTDFSVIQQFDIFAQLVASGSITATARALNLPAADVVEAMDGLEERLGCRLFAMEASMVELTATGEKLVKALGALSLDAQERWITGLLAGEAAADRSAEGAEEEEGTSSPPGRQPRDKEAGEEQPGPTKSLEHSGEHAALSHAEDPDTALPAEERAPSPAPVPTPAVSRTEPVRNIMLASHPAIFSHFQEALVAFEEASPDIGITLHLDAMDERRVQDLFTRKKADIAYFYALEEPEALASRYAWSERISLFTGKDHPLAQRDAAPAEDLAAVPYVALSAGNMARLFAEEALARCGLEVGPAVLETDNLYEIMKYMQSHPCYFATFGSMARDFGKMPGISRLGFAQGLPQVQVRQAVRPDLRNDSALLALAEFLFR